MNLSSQCTFAAWWTIPNDCQRCCTLVFTLSRSAASSELQSLVRPVLGELLWEVGALIPWKCQPASYCRRSAARRCHGGHRRLRQRELRKHKRAEAKLSSVWSQKRLILTDASWTGALSFHTRSVCPGEKTIDSIPEERWGEKVF